MILSNSITGNLFRIINVGLVVFVYVALYVIVTVLSIHV